MALLFTRPILASFAALFALSLPCFAASATAAAADKPEFNADIRPILSESCFTCHGPDKNNRKGKLRLDVREVAIEREAFKPGKPDESELVRRIFATNTDDLMPPPDSRKKLTLEQKETLKRWIASGAEYQPHWAYIKPARAQTPAVKDRAWVKNPIDAFVLAELEKKNLSHAPEADKRTLLRRLSLDLVGLPPTPEETAHFLKNNSSKAYEREVDRLLASPHFGERMAVPWLDLARFADTVGYHGDQNVNDFPYRDYVINAYNQNKPFDQFTIEQLAGDLLPRPTTEQLIASGFNRLNMVTREGGAQPAEYLAKYGADRVRTISTTWLGSTMGCCECHDHKFDPFSTKDFYSMKAFFSDIKQWGVYEDYAYTPNPDLIGFNNDSPFPPEIIVDSPYLHRRLDGVNARIDALEQTSALKLKTNAPQASAFDAWRNESTQFLKQHPDGWVTPKPELGADKSTNAPVLQDDGSILFHASADEVKLPLTSGWVAAVRVELLPRPEHEGTILLATSKSMVDAAKATTNGAAKAKKVRTAKLKGDSVMVKVSAELKSTNATQALSFYHADADVKDERYSNGYALIGVVTGWKTSTAQDKAPQTAVYLLEKPFIARDGDQLILHLGNAGVGCARVSVTPFAARDPLKSGNGAAIAEALKSRNKQQAARLYETFLLSASPDNKAFAEYKNLDHESLEYRGGKTPTVVTVAWKAPETRVLGRGNFQDQTGEIVEPAVPHFLPQATEAKTRRLTRLDLAEWLVSRDNPLTARAVMNRTWKQFFGTGISAVVDDLGGQGEWPTNPQLLDWLAVEFMDSHWDYKHMIKLMVMSDTYRQSSNPRPEIYELDPANRLYASQSPRRLEAEFVRDNALFVSGLLNPDIGGPSAFPYQPAGYYANIQFPNRDYVADTDDREYRRGVYTHWQRTFLQPMLSNFDAPAREECTGIRNVSNSPQQALTLLNDPTFVEAARKLAAKTLHATVADWGQDDKRINALYQTVLGRPAKPAEISSLESFLKNQREYCATHAEDAQKLLHVGISQEPGGDTPAEMAAWTEVCRVVLGLHETITRY